MHDKRKYLFSNNRYGFKCPLRDKVAFSAYCQGLDIKVPGEVGTVSNGQLKIINEPSYLPISSIINYHIDVFCKPEIRLQGRRTFHLKIKGPEILRNDEKISLNHLIKILETHHWLLQERITDQHQDLKRLYPESINTLRIITVNTGQRIEVLGAGLKMGINGKQIDKWSAGGILVPINSRTGSLTKWGYFKDNTDCKIDRHPDTNISFEGFKVPFFCDALQQTARLHAQMSGIHSIGWDIAITTTGPLIIEGNDMWDICLSQLFLKDEK